MGFWRQVFSDGGQGSSSRVLSFLCTAVASFSLVFFVVKTHTLPGIDAFTGLGMFCVAPYAINRVTTAWAKTPATPATP